MNIGELDGLKIVVSPERFEEIKKQKIIQENKILEEQQEKIDKYEEILDKIKEKTIQFKKDLQEYEEKNKKTNNSISIQLVGIKINAILELLEEIE